MPRRSRKAKGTGLGALVDGAGDMVLLASDGVVKHYDPTLLDVDALSRMPKRFHFKVKVEDKTLTLQFSHRVMTGMWLKCELRDYLSMDLSNYVLQTAGSVVDDDAWLIAVGVQPGTVLTLTPGRGEPGFSDTTPSIKASEAYLRYCHTQNPQYACFLEEIITYCHTVKKTLKEVEDHFGLRQNDDLQSLD